MVVWTEDDLNILRTEWSKGSSCSQISALLHRKFSRNAVIGKVRRLKLATRKQGTSHKRVDRVKNSATYLPPKRKPTRKVHIPVQAVQATQPTVVAPPEPVKPKRHREYLGKEFYNDGFLRIWISELQPRTSDILKIPNQFQCKWIKGDVKSSNAKWCRKPCVEGKSWCEKHNSIAYDHTAVSKYSSIKRSKSK